MIHSRKRHWVKYRSEKCKLYLRNDFHFKCAYCEVREQDNPTMQETAFEKDHFVSKFTDVPWDVDDYSNMVYACQKCNGTKSDQNVTLLLDPCKDDIYEGEHPHVQKMGEEQNYRVIGLTDKGKQFIESLQLNSGYYRQMRRKQFEKRYVREQISKFLDVLAPTDSREKSAVENYVDMLVECDETDDQFRCGISKAGEQLYQILLDLKEKQIPYRLLLEHDDLDVEIQFQGRTYWCEVKCSDYEGEDGRGPRLKEEKRKAWEAYAQPCGVLYYYQKVGQLELHVLTGTQYGKYVL